jgi:hypothetical protein
MTPTRCRCSYGPHVVEASVPNQLSAGNLARFVARVPSGSSRAAGWAPAGASCPLLAALGFVPVTHWGRVR